MLDVEFILVREHEVRQRAVGYPLEDFSAFLEPHCHMIVRKVLTTQHHKGLQPQIVSQHMVHCGFANTGCGGQDSTASAGVSSQLFSRVSEESRGADTPFSSAL